MKIQHNIYVAIVVLIFSLTVFLCALYNFGLSKVSNDDTVKKVVVEKGSIDSIAVNLYKNDLIRSKFAFKLYVKLHGKYNLMAATYNLSKNMGTRKIVDILSSGKKAGSDVRITFKEGINIPKVAKIISDKTNNTEDDVYSLLSDDNFLDEVINKYWFLDNSIKNKDIYYSLEGYLYPNTYDFASKDSSVEEIIIHMLDETNRQLSKYKEKFSSNSVHEVMTLASIVELEGTTLGERKKIARVFMNRLDSNMNLGSDVTTYYGVKVNMGDRDLYSEEVVACNNYNTRCATFKRIPISPICNPSIEAVEAVLNPDNNNYYYFVADKNKKIYFSETQKEHSNTINRLKRENLWYEY